VYYHHHHHIPVKMFVTNDYGVPQGISNRLYDFPRPWSCKDFVGFMWLQYIWDQHYH